MATQTKYTDVKGYATYYHYSGATTLPDVVPDFSRGRTIVFVHGAGSNGHTWHRQIEAFGAQHSRPFPNRAKYSFSMQRAGVLPIFTAS